MAWRRILIGFVLAVAVIGIAQVSNRYTAFIIASMAAAAISAMSLNVVIGFCGQISFAQGALMGVGAYVAGNLGNAGVGLPSLLGAGVAGMLVCTLIGLPALRLRGLYFAIATLAAQFIIEYLFKLLQPWTNGVSGLSISPLKVFGTPLSTDQQYATLAVATLFLSWLVLDRICTVDLGRAFRVVREGELAARGMGIDVRRTKLGAFMISGFFAGLSGGLVGFISRLANPEGFELVLSVDITAMIIVGGLGSLPGSIIGAAFVTLLPEVTERLGEALHLASDRLSAIREIIFGLLIIVFLVLEPRGLAALFGRLGRAVKRRMSGRRDAAAKSTTVKTETEGRTT